MGLLSALAVPKRTMRVVSVLVVLGGAAMIGFGTLAFLPARDLEKSVESDRQYLNASDTPLGRYFDLNVKYHEALKDSYLALARAFLVGGGVFVALGLWQLVLLRRLGGPRDSLAPQGDA